LKRIVIRYSLFVIRFARQYFIARVLTPSHYRIIICCSLLAIGSLFINSCSLIAPPEEIPAYIRVQSYTFTDSVGQGTTSSKVTDVWVNVENDNRGAYQIPVSVPVLQKGLKTVYLSAGVKENGVSANRLPYPFYQTYKVQTTLVPGQLDTIHPVFKYVSNVKISWGRGDFEGTNAVLNTTAINTAFTSITNIKDSVFEGNGSYEVDFSPGHDTFDIQSDPVFNATKLGGPVWLEMNYKTDDSMDVGAIILNNTTNPHEFVSGVTPTRKWNKIYINLTPTLQYWYPTTAFKIYFHAVNRNGGKAHLFLDNLKLLYLE
jgi:hypothetical protein